MEPPAETRRDAGAASAPRSTRPSDRPRPIFYLALPVLVVLIIGLAGAAVAAMFSPTVVGLRAGVERLSQRLKEEGATFRKLPRPPERSVIYANDGKTVLATVFLDENRDIVTLRDVAPIAQKAVLAIEDQSFYEHGALSGESVHQHRVGNHRPGRVDDHPAAREEHADLQPETNVRAKAAGGGAGHPDGAEVHEEGDLRALPERDLPR
jgi:membrane peptidoglycan carboxypeptidase